MEKRRVFNISFFALGIASLILLGFFDLSISKTLHNSDSYFGLFFRTAGDMPMYTFLPLLASTTFWLIKRTSTLSKNKKTLALSIALLLLVCLSLVFAERTLTYIPINGIAHIIAFLIIAAAVFVLTLLLFKNASTANIKKWFCIFVVAMVFAILSNLIVQVLKSVWGRVRFRSLSADYSDFSYWFRPNGFTGNKSFPSGHTASACGFLIMPWILNLFNVKKMHKALLNAFSIFFIFATALSRIILGAHFATDTLASILICYAMLLLSQRLYIPLMKRLSR